MYRRILISFSSGKTSAMMTWYLLKEYKAVWNQELKLHVGMDGNGITVHIIVAMANTSREEDKSLEFAYYCDLHFGFHTIWVEAVINKEHGVGTDFKIVDFKTAKRDGSIFEEMISVYGIPNQEFPHCTRELKTRPITKLARSYGWNEGTYDTYIGYRKDEPKRWKSIDKRLAAAERKHVYYLVFERQTIKRDVNKWWDQQPFNLNLPAHKGNCKKCWKKSFPKLAAIEAEELNADKIDTWVDSMEEKYQYFTPESRTECNPPYRFHRGNKTQAEIREWAKLYFKDFFGDENKMEIRTKGLLGSDDPEQLELFDCNESCEPFQ